MASRLKVVCMPFIGTALLLACGASLEASSWPRFRGPNGTGISGDADVPVRWTEKNFLWKTPIPGKGNSSPVVWGNQIFLQSASEDGSQRMLVCVNANDGKTIWVRQVAGTKATTHDLNTMASSTPATDGERVYAVFWDGKDILLYAYSIQGEFLWKYDMGPYTSQHGPGMSPIVFHDKVFVNNDQDGTAELLAVEAKTGQRSWHAAREPFRACYSTPFLLEREGKAAELIVLSTSAITSYEPDTGKVNWNVGFTYEGMPLRTVASPIYSDGLIFGNSGDGGGSRQSFAVKLNDENGHSNANLAWTVKRDFPYVPTMLIYGDNLFYTNDRGIASCRVAATGKEIWSERIGQSFSASPVLVDGKIYAIDQDGKVIVFAATTKFTLLAKNSLGEGVMASPAVTDGKLLIRGAHHLFCIGKSNGS